MSDYTQIRKLISNPDFNNLPLQVQKTYLQLRFDCKRKYADKQKSEINEDNIKNKINKSISNKNNFINMFDPKIF
ncbi:MAG: hypothetical protein MJ187_02765 [Alphaproteobacteria bacterium]|nr:hypothetical protein [Alphaproteobacteria bacterium]